MLIIKGTKNSSIWTKVTPALLAILIVAMFSLVVYAVTDLVITNTFTVTTRDYPLSAWTDNTCTTALDPIEWGEVISPSTNTKWVWVRNDSDYPCDITFYSGALPPGASFQCTPLSQGSVNPHEVVSFLIQLTIGGTVPTGPQTGNFSFVPSTPAG